MDRELLATALSLLRVVRKSRYPERLPDHIRHDTCVVLGNGPSLFADIKGHASILQKTSVICVNLFAESDLYEQIQPDYYVFADPAFWDPTAPESMILMRNQCFDHILKRTSWEIIIAAPFEAKPFFQTVFSRAPKVRLVFYNNVPLWGARRVLHYLFSLGLGLPSAQNVLIPALYMALRFGFRKVILVGADHSWHESVSLDSENRVCLRDRHFYDQEAELKPFSMDGSAERLFTMDSLFHALATMFEGYWRIEGYSDYLGARITNASSTTFIDAFKRQSFMKAVEDFSIDNGERT